MVTSVQEDIEFKLPSQIALGASVRSDLVSLEQPKKQAVNTTWSLPRSLCFDKTTFYTAPVLLSKNKAHVGDTPKVTDYDL